MQEQGNQFDGAQASREDIFAGVGGRWATERMAAAIKAGRRMSPKELRTNDTLRHEDWKFFDKVLLNEKLIRLRGLADLVQMGLTVGVPNAMGKVLYQYERDTQMGDADISLDGVAQTGNDRTEFNMDGVPLYITHKDFSINLRTLEASKNSGDPLDANQTRKAGRSIVELSESILFNGSTKVFAGKAIYGYANATNRNTASFGTNGNWAAAAKTGADILADVLTMKQALINDRFFGPYMIYVDPLAETKLDGDFKSYVSQTIRQRILTIDGISGITVADQMPANAVIMVQMTNDVVELIQGEPLQTVQWDAVGGFKLNFKAFQIEVPLVRNDIQSRSGICHMT